MELAYCVPLGIPHSTFLEWDPLDQDKALAWWREQKKVCRGCGTRKEEWDKDKFAYVGDIDYCAGCEIIEQERGHIKTLEEEQGRMGLAPRLVPRALAKENQEADGT